MKNKIISHNFSGQSLVLVYLNEKGLQTVIVESSHANWNPLLKAYKARQFDRVIELSDMRGAINAAFGGTFKVEGDAVLYNGEPVSGYLFDRIIYFMRENLPWQHLVRFAENLYQNPSARAREELYTFLAHKNMPIFEDGTFGAYKGIRSNFYSKTSGNIRLLKGKVDSNGHIYNGVNETIEVDRGDVCDDTAQDCARGIHAGSKKYATEFAGGDGIVVIVKINPKDVVSIPTACECQKLRACAYTVLAQETRTLSDKEVYYDKVAMGQPLPETTPDEDAEYWEGYEDGWNDGVEDRDNPVLNGTAESAIGQLRDSLGRFLSKSAKGAKRDKSGRFC